MIYRLRKNHNLNVDLEMSNQGKNLVGQDLMVLNDKDCGLNFDFLGKLKDSELKLYLGNMLNDGKIHDYMLNDWPDGREGLNSRISEILQNLIFKRMEEGTNEGIDEILSHRFYKFHNPDVILDKLLDEKNFGTIYYKDVIFHLNGRLPKKLSYNNFLKLYGFDKDQVVEHLGAFRIPKDQEILILQEVIQNKKYIRTVIEHSGCLFNQEIFDSILLRVGTKNNDGLSVHNILGHLDSELLNEKNITKILESALYDADDIIASYEVVNKIGLNRLVELFENKGGRNGLSNIFTSQLGWKWNWKKMNEDFEIIDEIKEKFNITSTKFIFANVSVHDAVCNHISKFDEQSQEWLFEEAYRQGYYGMIESRYGKDKLEEIKRNMNK